MTKRWSKPKSSIWSVCKTSSTAWYYIHPCFLATNFIIFSSCMSGRYSLFSVGRKICDFSFICDFSSRRYLLSVRLPVLLNNCRIRCSRAVAFTVQMFHIWSDLFRPIFWRGNVAPVLIQLLSGRTQVLSSSKFVQHPHALAIFEDFMYYSDRRLQRLQVYPKYPNGTTGEYPSHTFSKVSNHSKKSAAAFVSTSD